MSVDSWTEAGRDLLLGAACVGCGSPGRVLCGGCAQSLPRRGLLSWPTPTPCGLAPPYAAGDYDGLLRILVNRHKEEGAFSLAGPLGRVLGDVVADLLDDLTAATEHVCPPVSLVPVPSRRGVVRVRGHDPLLRVARAAGRRLRGRGVRAGVSRLLVPEGRVRDQSTLGAAERSANLAGSMRARGGRLRETGPVVVVDDVLTTGATAREAQRALEEAGLQVVGIAAVAATRRRLPPRGAGASEVSYRSSRQTATVPVWSPSGSVVAPPECGKPMPVAGEAVHVRRASGACPSAVDHGAA